MDGSPRSLPGFDSLSADQAANGACPRVRELSAFSEIYREHFAFVWALVRRAGVPSEQVDDATQEVFLTAHRRLHTFVPGSSMRAWLYGITRRVSWRHRRTVQRRLRKHAAFAGDRRDVVRGCEDRVDASAVLERVLGAVEEGRRAVFVLSELHGMSRTEISEALGVPAGTVASRLRAARRDVADEVRRVGLDDRRAGDLLHRSRRELTPSDRVLARGWVVLLPQLLQTTAVAPAAVSVTTGSSVAVRAAVAAALAVGSWSTWGPGAHDDPSTHLSHDGSRVGLISSAPPSRRIGNQAPSMVDARDVALIGSARERRSAVGVAAAALADASAPGSMSAADRALRPTAIDRTTAAWSRDVAVVPSWFTPGPDLGPSSTSAALHDKGGSRAARGSGTGAGAVSNAGEPATGVSDVPGVEGLDGAADVHVACAEAGDAIPALAVHDHAEVHVVLGNGSDVLIEPPMIEDGWRVDAVALTDDTLVVAWSQLDPLPLIRSSTVVVYDVDLSVRTVSPPRPGRVTALDVDEGRVVLTRELRFGMQETSIIEADGYVQTLAGYSALTAGVGEWIPVAIGESGFGWVDPSDRRTFAELSGSEPLLWYRSFDDAIVAAVSHDDLGELLVARPGNHRRLPIDTTAAALTRAAVATSEVGWLVIAEPVAGRFWRLTGGDGPLESLPFGLPRGSQWFGEASCSTVAVDDTGGPVVGVVQNDVVRVIRHDGVEWQPVGDPLREVAALEVYTRGDTFLVTGHEQTERCMPQRQKSAVVRHAIADTALLGDSVTVTGPTGRTHVLAAVPGTASLRSDGGCVAYQSAGDGTIELAEPGSGLAVRTGLRGRVVWRH